MNKRQRTAILIALTAISLTLVSASAAAVAIKEGRGAGRARLGQLDTKAAGYLGRHGASQRDPNYGSRIVYWINFGKKTNGRYPCEMASNAAHRVFQFSFNSSTYVTSKGVRVGSKEEALTARYGQMKRIHTTKFNHYVLGKRPFTDFWVLNKTGRVFQIVVRSK